MGFWKILFSLKSANLYLLESVRLAKCCFGKNLIDGPTFEKINMKPMRWMIENIKLHCIFHSISFYFIFDMAMKNWKSKKNLRLFCVLFRTLLLKSRISDVPRRNSTLLLLEYNIIFLQECLNILEPQIL